MKKPMKVVVLCVGTSPLMMDQMSNAALQGLVTGVRPQVQKDRALDVIAAEKIYRDEMTKRIGIPATMITKALINAGRNVKNGKKAVSTAETTSLFSFLSMEAQFLPFVNIPADVTPESDAEKAFWAVDVRRGVGYQAKTPTAVGIVRPKFKDWSFEVEIVVDSGKIGLDSIRAIFDEAGLTQGLGSFRPNKRGPFGMFKVGKWEVSELPTEASVSHLGKKAA